MPPMTAAFVFGFVALMGLLVFKLRKRSGARGFLLAMVGFLGLVCGFATLLASVRTSELGFIAEAAGDDALAGLPANGSRALVWGTVSQGTTRACSPHVACLEWHESMGRSEGNGALNTPSAIQVKLRDGTLQVTGDRYERTGWKLHTGVSLHRLGLDADDAVGVLGFVESDEGSVTLRATWIHRGDADGLRAEATERASLQRVLRLLFGLELVMLLLLGFVVYGSRAKAHASTG